MDLTLLYPEIEPHQTGMLQVSNLHSVYYEVCGNPEGKPVAVLHGGPGSGSRPFFRRFYDPKEYRIVLFDQRGCGKSTPLCEFKENTTFDLIDDMEKLRKLLGIEKWLLVGGSWGSTLALAFACCHPEQVAGVIVFGIFTCRKSEIDWLFQAGGASNVFPEYRSGFEDIVPVGERNDMVQAYHKRLTGDNAEEQLAFAKAWSKWECACENFFISEDRVDQFDQDWAICRARHECHYFAHGGFFNPRWPSENALLDQVHKMAHLPGTIIQGRYDMICPIRTAYALHQRWPTAEFHVIADAGHAPTQPSSVAAFLTAIDDFRKQHDW